MAFRAWRDSWTGHMKKTTPADGAGVVIDWKGGQAAPAMYRAKRPQFVHLSVT